MKDKTIRQILILFFIGIIFIAVAPYLFTRDFGFFSFDETGPIGDTIGGITAPFTSLLGSILVFFALKAQIDANKIIQQQIESQKKEDDNRKKLSYLNEQINIIRNDINDFSYSNLRNAITNQLQLNYRGSEAIVTFVKSIQHKIDNFHDEDFYSNNPKLTELLHLLKIIYSMFESIRKMDIPREDKQFYTSQLKYHYISKIKPAFASSEMQWNDETTLPCRKCGKKHGHTPAEIYNLIIKINSIK